MILAEEKPEFQPTHIIRDRGNRSRAGEYRHSERSEESRMELPHGRDSSLRSE
jgi:hypothetical protein